MLGSFINSLGYFVYPQAAMSLITAALVLGYGVAWMRGELLRRNDKPWRQTLLPLGSIALSIGLLGSVYAFLSAFSGFQGGVDVQRITTALSLGYATTLVGLTQSIMASVCCYLLGLVKTKA